MTAARSPDSLLECDMIMKGGITSGVVYPLAASHLAQKYRFRNVGGASAGAIAAVMVAAAEYGRQHGHDGFVDLDELPDELGNVLGDLFQPAPKAAPAYDVLTALIDKKKSTVGKVLAVVGAALRSAPLAAVITFILAALPGVAFAFGLDGRDGGPIDYGNVVQIALYWLPVPALLTIGVALARFALNTKAAVEANGFGLCDGHSQRPGASVLPLTDWLSAKIDSVAGLAAGHAPLTFGDLWGPGAVASFEAHVPADKPFLSLPPWQRSQLTSERVISLEVMTTNLTLCRPYRFPFESREFFFCAECLTEYFPPAVVSQMCATGPEAEDELRSGATVGSANPADYVVMRCPRHPATQVRWFPRPAAVPIVLAARLSLSFPVLISAVPLCYVARDRPAAAHELIVVWISDGGITSNFPMHFFDTPSPVRPTFGINLEPRDEFHSEDTHLPMSSNPRAYPITSLPAFGGSLINTMHNWVDALQLTLPAYRGRVAEIRLDADEGGMNLHMPKELIERLADRGERAAAEFDGFDLGAHQEKRFQIAMAALDDLLTDMWAAQSAGFADVIEKSTPLTRRQAALALLQLAEGWQPGHPGAAGYIPHPVGDFKIAPRQ